MVRYRIHRLRPHLRAFFRSAPHTSGEAQVKARDYEQAGEVEAVSPYAAFLTMRGSDAPLEVGDMLESEDGSLRICKFVGFEPAQWAIPAVAAEAVALE